MDKTLESQIENLKNLPLEELRQKYQKIFLTGEIPSNNKVYLWRKIAYKLQETEYGGLSQETREKIQELIRQYDPINNKALRTKPGDGDKMPINRDKRLPIPGTVITKQYKDKTIQVKVLENGFEYNSKIYKSLGAIAKEVTGNHWNAYIFFGL